MVAITASNQPPLKFSAQISVLQAPTSTQKQEANKAWLHFVAERLNLLSLGDIVAFNF